MKLFAAIALFVSTSVFAQQPQVTDADRLVVIDYQYQACLQLSAQLVVQLRGAQDKIAKLEAEKLKTKKPEERKE